MKAPLVIPPGIVSDDTTFASAGRWADGNNVRFWRGAPQTIGGWSTMIAGISTGTCRAVMSWTDNSGYLSTAFGTNSKLYAYQGGALADITPSSGFTAGEVDGAGGPGYGAGGYNEGAYSDASTDDYFPLTWSFANWGEYLLACPRNQTIFEWQNDTGAPAAAVTNAPDNVTYMIVTPERQVLALGCNEEVSTTFNPMCIRGCASEDNTDWTTATDNNAFEHILDGSGRIVAGAMIGPYVAVWTDNAVYLGQYIGEPDQTYRFDLVATGCGLAGPGAFHVHNQRAFWVSPDFQFYTWTVEVPPTLIPCPIRNDFKDNMAVGQNDKIVCTSIGQFDEVWWFYPDSRDGLECSRYVAVSAQDGAWFRGQMARSAVTDAGPTSNPIFVSTDGTAYWHENGNTADGGALTWSLTTADGYINEAGDFMLIRGMWPDFETQQGAVSLTLTVRNWPQATTTYTHGPYSLTKNKNKSDFMLSGRVISAEFSGESSPAFVRFGKPIWDADIAGQF